MKKSGNLLSLIFFTIGLFFCSTICVEAATFLVTSSADDLTDTCSAAPLTCTLREAVNDANLSGGADNITFAANVTTITLVNGQITITDAVTIGSATAVSLTTILGDPLNNPARIFNIAAGGNTTLNKLELANGSATGNGGAILNSGAILIVNDSVIRDNEASGNGGGISTSGGTVNINRSTIGGTRALGSNRAGSGGGIFNLNGMVTLTNSTISGNQATGFGGGYYGFTDIGAGSLMTVSATVANNRAMNGGGIAVSANLGVSTANLNNTIVADNIGDGSGPDLFGSVVLGIGGTIISSGYNLIETTSGTTIVPTTGDQFNVNPLLVGLLALQNNGGLTPTHGLKITVPVSLALDQGNTTQTTDQRGFTRAANFPTPPATGGNDTDIGAFEAQLGATAAAVAVSGRVRSSSGRGIARARVSLTDSNGATRVAMTNFFGYYRFADVPVGGTYIFNVASKFGSSDPQVLTITEELTELDFVADF